MFPMLAIYAYTWFNPLGYMDEESPHYLWNKEKVNSEETCYYDTIILGDSMANAAYMPEVLSDTAINLSLGGMTPVENYYVLQDWLTTHRAPQVCYLSFQDAHMIMEDCFWTRTMYSHRFRREQNLEILRGKVQLRRRPRRQAVGIHTLNREPEAGESLSSRPT